MDKNDAAINTVSSYEETFIYTSQETRDFGIICTSIYTIGPQTLQF